MQGIRVVLLKPELLLLGVLEMYKHLSIGIPYLRLNSYVLRTYFWQKYFQIILTSLHVAMCKYCLSSTVLKYFTDVFWFNFYQNNVITYIIVPTAR